LISYSQKKAFILKSFFIFLSALVFLAINVSFSPAHLVYDENYFYPNIAYLHNVGLFTFIKTYTGQAPGPLYELVHYLTYLLSNSILFVRFDNLLFSFLNILLISWILKRTGSADYVLQSLLYICVPLSWVNSGIALTETPTILFSLLSFYFLCTVSDKAVVSLTDVIIISVCISLSIIGRSTFIVQVVALGVFFVYKLKERRYSLLCIAALSLIAPLYLFYTWQGLMPPNQAFLSGGGGFSVYHFLLAIAYTGICLFIMYPNTIINIRQKPLLFLAIATATFLVLLRSDILIPLQTIKLAHPAFLKYAVLVFYSASAALFVISFIANTMEEEKGVFILISIFLLLLVCTSIKITHQFSARYVFQSVPFLILVFRKYYRNNLLQFLINTFGILMGMISLQGYYH